MRSAHRPHRRPPCPAGYLEKASLLGAVLYAVEKDGCRASCVIFYGWTLLLTAFLGPNAMKLATKDHADDLVQVRSHAAEVYLSRFSTILDVCCQSKAL